MFLECTSLLCVISMYVIHYLFIRYFGITGKGIANLIISLPELTLLKCEPYLLREALSFVRGVNVSSREFGLRYLHAAIPDKEFLLSAARLCPHIAELVVKDQGEECVQAVSEFKHLKVGIILERCPFHNLLFHSFRRC